MSNCEQEQIHLAGSIQPHGALLVVRETDFTIVQVSTNAQTFLNLDRSLLGMRLEELEGDLWQRIRSYLSEPLHLIPIAIKCTVGSRLSKFDCLIHRPSSEGLVIELENTGPSVDLSKHVETALKSIIKATSLRTLCDESTRLFKDLTGYDRVMVYRFDDEGHGEVFAERREDELEAFLGNRYPASDIPQMARRLYIKNRVRVLVDVEYDPTSLESLPLRSGAPELDMSLCFLRSMSPIHVQYLKNMGVCATLVASLVVGGRLWGLIACHHYKPMFVHYETRVTCELLAETLATRIAALEGFDLAEAELTVRRLEQRMIKAASLEGDWKKALFEKSRSLLEPLHATGAALLFEGEVLTAGEVPGTHDLRSIGNWIDRTSDSPVAATASLAVEAPEFAHLASVASGIIAARISNTPGEYILWFRPERKRTVTWGGNPFKPVEIGNDPSDLSPRRSFSQWHQLVEGTSDSWSASDINAATLIGKTLSNVVVQFRSVRMVIAQSQLHQVSEQIRNSDQPVVIAVPDGTILHTNSAFDELFASSRSPLQNIGDLAPCFSEVSEAHVNLDNLLRHHQTWNAEIELQALDGANKALAVRADPVFSAPSNLLGFVFLFTDLTEYKEAEKARRRFQEGIVDNHQMNAMHLNSRADLLYRNLLSSVVGNAQLAALEITDSMNIANIPDKLESIQASVTRTTELLDHLIWHATDESDNDQ